MVTAVQATAVVVVIVIVEFADVAVIVIVGVSVGAVIGVVAAVVGWVVVKGRAGRKVCVDDFPDTSGERWLGCEVVKRIVHVADDLLLGLPDLCDTNNAVGLDVLVFCCTNLIEADFLIPYRLEPSVERRGEFRWRGNHVRR